MPTHVNGAPPSSARSTVQTSSAGLTVPPSGAGLTVPPSAAFSRVTVVAPRTRIDLALPCDVAVANLLPMLLTMAGESSPDGGSKHGGWCLAKIGGDAIDPERSLSSLGVLDGDLLQIRRRNDNPPPPLFDDVVEAIAEATPGSYRPWTEHTARVLGLIAAGLALLASAAGLLRAGTLAGASLGAGAHAGVTAVVVLIAGVVTARVYGETSAGVVMAAGSLVPSPHPAPRHLRWRLWAVRPGSGRRTTRAPWTCSGTTTPGGRRATSSCTAASTVRNGRSPCPKERRCTRSRSSTP